jgi:hypothetical protein
VNVSEWVSGRFPPFILIAAWLMGLLFRVRVIEVPQNYVSAVVCQIRESREKGKCRVSTSGNGSPLQIFATRSRGQFDVVTYDGKGVTAFKRLKTINT